MTRLCRFYPGIRLTPEEKAWKRCLHALCKYSWIVFMFLSLYIIYVFIDCIFQTDHTSLSKLHFSYLYITLITNYYYYMYFIVKTHSVLSLLLPNDKSSTLWRYSPP